KPNSSRRLLVIANLLGPTACLPHADALFRRSQATASADADAARHFAPHGPAGIIGGLGPLSQGLIPSKGRAPGFLDARQVPSCARDAAAGQGPAGIARARPIWMNPPHRRRRSRGQRASASPLPCRAAPSSLFPSAA